MKQTNQNINPILAALIANSAIAALMMACSWSGDAQVLGVPFFVINQLFLGFMLIGYYNEKAGD